MQKKQRKTGLACLINFSIAITLTIQSCSKPIYIFGALTRSNLYAYSPENTYNNQGGVDWYPKLGIQLGIAASITDVDNKFSLRTEVNTSFQGAKYEDVSNSVEGSINLLYTYVPLILRYNPDSRIICEAGFQPGILVSARDRIGKSSTYFSDYVNNLDFGMTGGLGYEINDKISLSLMGYLGFINISEAGTDAKNNTVVAIRGTYLLKKSQTSKSTGY